MPDDSNDLDQKIILEGAALTERGMVRTQVMDLDGAMADLDEAIRLNQDNAVAYSLRGDAHLLRRDLDEAIADYGEAIRLTLALAERPGYWVRDNGGGIHEVQEGQHLGLLSTSYESRAWSYYLKGELDQALADLDRMPSRAGAHPTLLSQIYFAQGSLEKARRAAPASFHDHPVDAEAIAMISIILYGLGESNEAAQDWRMLLRFDETFRDADWVGKKFDWRPELIEAARRLIAKLNP